MSRAILTTAELAERWSMTLDSTLEIVRARRVPFMLMSVGKPNGGVRGRKQYRFRLVDIETWESNETKFWKEDSVVPDRSEKDDATQDAMARAAGWDGVSRLTRSY